MDGFLLKFDGGLLDTLVLEKSNERFVLAADDENVIDTCTEGITTGILKVNHVDVSGVMIVLDDLANASDGTTSGDHSQSANLEFNVIVGLAGSEVNLKGVVSRNGGVTVANRASIGQIGIRDTLLANDNFANFAEFEGSLFSGDLVRGEASLGIKEHTEVLVGLIDSDDILMSAREGSITADLAVNLDQLLHDNEFDLVVSDSVVKTVPQQDGQRDGFSGFVRSRRGLRGIDTREFTQTPSARTSNELLMLLNSTGLKNKDIVLLINSSSLTIYSLSRTIVLSRQRKA